MQLKNPRELALHARAGREVFLHLLRQHAAELVAGDAERAKAASERQARVADQQALYSSLFPPHSNVHSATILEKAKADGIQVLALHYPFATRAAAFRHLTVLQKVVGAGFGGQIMEDPKGNTHLQISIPIHPQNELSMLTDDGLKTTVKAIFSELGQPLDHNIRAKAIRHKHGNKIVVTREEQAMDWRQASLSFHRYFASSFNASRRPLGVKTSPLMEGGVMERPTNAERPLQVVVGTSAQSHLNFK